MDLPFPSEPVADPYSMDDRKNGAIYADSTARDAIQKFVHLLVRPTDFLNRVRLAYVWAKGDSESGRGVGKTAFLRRFQRRINRDWGHTEFSGQHLVAVVYVAFREQVDRRYTEQLAASALVDVCRSGLVNACRTSLRLKALSPGQEAALIETVGEEKAWDALLDDDVLRRIGVDPDDLDSRVAAGLRDEHVEASVANAVATGTFERWLRSLRRDGNLEPLYVPRDTGILDRAMSILFNDVVRVMRAAGFAGAYLFVDDIENLVDQMTRRERLEFAKQFGLCTVRPGYANSQYSFFSCVLTTHLQASNALCQAWGEAGLATIARLDPGSPNSVELPFPSREQAKDILVAHMDHYRIDETQKGSIAPFTADGLDTLMENRPTVHPRDLLSRASTVMREAIEQGVDVIDAAFIKQALAVAAYQPAADFADGLEGAA
jgi:hypothetical protein